MKLSPNLKRLLLAILFYFLYFNAGNVEAANQNAHAALVLSRSATPYEQAVDAIKDNFKGDKTGISFSEYNLKGDAGNAGKIIEDIKNNNPDLVFVIGTEAADAISKLISQTPIVAAMIYEAPPEPRNNQYGVFLEVPFKDRFRIYKQLGLAQTRYALPHLDGKKKYIISEAKKAAEEASVQLIEIRMSSLKDFHWALEEAHKKADYLLMVLDNELYKRATARELLLFSARNQLPLVAFSRNYVKSGALLSISSEFKANGRQAAMLAKSILAKNPVKQKFHATNVYEIAWNKNVARAFGIELRPQAKEIITHFY